MATRYSPSIVTSGLVLALDAANVKSSPGTGTTWADLSGNNKNGTLTNGPTFSSINGGTIVFDGLNDYVNIGVGTGVNQLPADFTVSLWARATAANSNWGNLIGDYYTNTVLTTNEWQIMMNNSSASLNFYVVGPGYVIGNTSSGFSANTWINVVLTRIGSAVTLYANNNVIATATNSTSLGTATGNLDIGIDGNNSAEPFSGNIASVLVYKNRGLTATEVLQNYNALKKRFGL